MKKLYQNWTIGGSGYAVLQDKQIVENRKFNKPDKENNNLVCVYSITESGEVQICYNISNVQSIIVDGVSIDPVNYYNFEETGEHTIEFVLVDKTIINEEMFFYCTTLISVNIPNSIKVIENWAFDFCSLLKSIVIPDSVISIGEIGLSTCNSLTSIKISKNNPVYDSRDNCNAIIETKTNTLLIGTENTIIPDSVTSIGESAFQERNLLISIVIPDSVTTIDKDAFRNCTSLESIHIGKNVVSIAGSSFTGCDKLMTITVDIDGYYYVENNILINKSNYSIVFIPTNLEHIIIPENVKTLESLRYRRMKTIILNEQLERIEKETFENCSKLESIVIPNSVTYLGNKAFDGCNSLTSVTIGNGITSIGDKVFSRCNNVQYYDFTAHINIPTLSNTNAFDEIKADCEIRVPAVLYNDWINADNWSTYSDHIVAV